MSQFIAFSGSLGVDYRDAGPWRDYFMETRGESRASLILNATLSEIDQDGGELRSYGIHEASALVASKAIQVIEEVLAKAQEKTA